MKKKIQNAITQSNVNRAKNRIRIAIFVDATDSVNSIQPKAETEVL